MLSVLGNAPFGLGGKKKQDKRYATCSLLYGGAVQERQEQQEADEQVVRQLQGQLRQEERDAAMAKQLQWQLAPDHPSLTATAAQLQVRVPCHLSS